MDKMFLHHLYHLAIYSFVIWQVIIGIWLLLIWVSKNIKFHKSPILGIGETIQKKISSFKNIKKLKKTDVLIVRHILEHCYDIKRFINNLKKMVKKNGYIVFEVPDCEQSLLRRDYVMMWEELI